MRKHLLLLLVLASFIALQVNGQWSVDALGTDYTIDFETTVSGVNEGAFDGSGFATTPATGQLNADAWAVSGMSDGFKDFGVEKNTGDFARGSSAGGVLTGGIYSFEVETGNYTLGVQPSSSDFAPGWIGLKLQNNTGETINSINVSYDIWEFNNEGRSSTFDGEFSLDGTNWLPITELEYATGLVADATPTWVKTNLSYSGSLGTDIANGDFLYFRWSSVDNGGSGARDEIAVDNITVNLSYELICNPITSFPFFEGFEDTYPVDCWTLEYANAAYPSGNAMSHSTSQAYEGSQSFRFSSYSSGAPYEQYLITPELNMSSTQLVEFWYRRSSSGSETFAVGTSTTGNNITTDFTWGADVTDATASWKKFSMDLNADVKYVAIQYKTQHSYYLYVDNFTVREVSSENDILTFSFSEQTGLATIDNVAHTVEIEVAMHTDLSALTPTITVSDYASISPESGVAQDFTNPVTYTVTAEDGTTTQDWLVTVTESTTQSSEKNIVSFTLPTQTGPATIDNTLNTVEVEVDWLTDITALTPTIIVSDLATISPLSGVQQDFTTPVTYTVTAEDASTKDYTVTVTLAGTPLGANCSNPFVVDIPTQLTYNHSGSTEGLGNIYTVSSSYGNGEDAIYRLDVTSSTVVKITMTTTTTWTGLFLFDDCPDVGNIITSVTNSGSSDRVITQALTAGTYFVMLDIWPTPNFFSYDLTIEAMCPAPTAIETINLTATSTDLQWTAGGFETAWNVEVSTTQLTDLTTETGDIFTGNVTTTPLLQLTTLDADTDYYVYVQSACGSDWVEYMFTTLPTCPTPTDLTASNITATSAELAWIENGTALAWNLKVSITSIDPSIDPGDFNTALPSNPFTIPAGTLTPNTTYYWYIQANCGGSDLSNWSAEGEFSTPCEPVSTLPFFEGFEDGYTNQNAVDGCWTQESITGTQVWTANSSLTTYNRTPRTGNFNAYLRYGNKDWMYYPFEFTAGITYKVELYARQDATSGANITVSYGDNAKATSMTNAIIPETAVTNGNYQLLSGEITPTTSDVFYIGILGELTSSPWYLSIDDFTVRELSSENDILTFSFAEQSGPATISNTTHTVNIEVAMGTDLSTLIPTITVSDYASISPESGVAQDFTNPVTYTVTAEDGTTTQDWLVTVTESITQSSEKDIVSFTLPTQTGPATIDNTLNTVEVEVDWLTDITALTPTIIVSDLATISPLSGVQQDFTTPVTYTVTAEDASTKDYTVTVTLEGTPLGANCSNPFVVDIPTALPYEDLSQTNCGLGNIYQLVGQNYTGGEDAIYRLDVTSSTVVKLTMTTTTSWTGLFLFDACPDVGNIITSVTNSGTSDRVITHALNTGTYYIMIDTYASPDCIPEYNLTIEAMCPAPTAIETINLTATSTDLQWTAGGFETAWNIKVNEATAIADPSTTDGDIIANNPVSPTPEYSIVSGLTAETDYYVYIQADCGSDWAEFMFTTPSSCPIPTGLTASDITTNSATLTWNELGVSGWVIEISSTYLMDPETETGDIANDVYVSGTVGTYNVTGLDANTTYYWYVKSACGSGWAHSTFKTSEVFFPLPISENFEAGLGNIIFINGTQANYWTNGPLASQTGNAMFVTNNGTDNQYTISGSTSVSHAYIPVDFGGATDVLFNFDWICNGEGAYTPYDYLRVYLVPESTTLTAGTLPPVANQLETYNLQTTLQNESITLSATEITQNKMKLVFTWRNDANGGTQPPASVDNISLTEISCFAPTNLVLDATTTTEATFSWTTSGTETSWNLIYGTPGFNPTSEGTIVVAPTNPYTITGLTSATLYDVYVQANCGVDDLSSMVGPVILATNCEAYSVPYTENFDTWGTGSDAFPICWTRPVTYGTSPIYPSCVSAQSVSSPNSLRFQSALDNYTCAVTPAFAEDINNLMVSFNLRREGTSSGVIQVGVMSDPNDVTTFELVETIDPSETGTWIYYEVMFNATTLSGPNNYIAFRQNPISTAWYYWLDDLTVKEIPACPNPSDLYAVNITQTSADLGWTIGLIEDTWNVEYGETGFTPGDGTLISGTMDNPVTVTDLTANTAYEFYVQADCGADQSDWIGSYEFTTQCDIIALPFFEGFENNSTTLNCWTALDLDADGYTWALYTDDSYEGEQSMASRWHSLGTSNDWLISPQLAIDADNYVLDFFAKSTSSYSLEDFEVLISTTGNNPVDFTIMLESIASHPNAWTQHIYKLSDYGINSGDNIYIAIRHISEDQLRLLVDAFQVRAISSETDFITYSFPEQTGAANIDYNNFTIEIEVGNGTDLTGLIANFEVSEEATADIAGTTQESGVTVNDFTTPVTYTVTAEDGTTTQDWLVTVTEAAINTETDILTYTFPEATSVAAIDNTEKTVDINVLWHADITALTAEFELSYGASASIGGTTQVSATTTNDFTMPVTYTVTAEDGTTTTDWTVNVTPDDVPLGANCENPFTVSLPANLPYSDAGQTTCGLGNVYEDTEMNYYDGGEDAIYEITVTSDVVVNIMLDPGTNSWTGIGLFSSCPSTDNMIELSTNSSASIHGFEEIALSAGTYYIMIDSWPSPNCIDSYELSITPGSVLDFANNTTLTLTPETQSIAPGDDANAVLNIVYPETISANMPTDIMTDAMIDLSELTAGAVVELLNAGTSLGTYTVTGGETVWASEAFTGVISVPAYLTEGESINWDVVVSGLAIGTYNVGATLYLGLAADLAAQTNMTEAATDAMQIIVETLPEINVIDLNGDVTDVAVCLGTEENDAIVLLTDVITITDTEDNEFTVTLNWTIDTYDANTPAVYDATGTFELPAGVSQTDPATALEVTATVTVNALPVVTCPQTMNVAVNTPVDFTGHTPEGGTFSGTGVVGDTFDPNGLENDTYVITYTYTDPTTGCENFCEFNVIVDVDISVTDITVEGIGIYPNPNNGQFTIDFNNIEGSVNYQIYDTKGSIIVSENISANGNTIQEVSLNLVPGVYFVKIVTTNQTFVEKLVIE